MINGKIWLSSPTMHGDDELTYIHDAFNGNWVAPLGPNVNSFEQEMAAYMGIGHAAATVSGTSALHLAVKLAGVKPGDTVFCSDLTFSATVNPVSYEGARQVFIDSERDSWNMDPRALDLAFAKHPECRCVIAANLYGTPAKLDELRAICDAHHAVLIEDAAESLSATFRGRQTGTFGTYNAISFNGNKIITTSGGGMLLSDDEEAIQKARFWSTQSRDPAPWYQHSELGYNYRMSNIVAGIGRGQLKHLDEHRLLKKRLRRLYEEALADLPVTLNPYLPYTEPNFWLTCLTINPGCPLSPMALLQALSARSIEARPIWKPMHMQPLYASNEFISIDAQDVGADIFARGLCLPSDIKNTDEDMEMIIGIIRNCLK